tara:strand:- start:1505 stop:2032 length:528 start_codon:yes stop_codon:yes gene_type:complete
MAQITSITSEALQAKIRQLLPSQQGFGEDLQAQNVIVPIIDLTETAEGSTVRADLQTAIAFGSQTAFEVTNASTTIANTTGFYRIFGVVTCSTGTANTGGGFTMSDGLTTKQVWAHIDSGHASLGVSNFDFTVFLSAGESINAFADSTNIVVTGSVRQIADVNGNLTNPSGFTPQ